MIVATGEKLIPVVIESVFQKLPSAYKLGIKSSLMNIAVERLFSDLQQEYVGLLLRLDVTETPENFQMQYVAVKQMQLCMEQILYFINNLGDIK